MSRQINVAPQSEEKNLSIVLNTVQQYAGKTVKESDIAVKTGLSANEVADCFEALMGEYMCNIKVDAQGELIYLFDFSEKLKDEEIIPFSQKLKTKVISGLILGFKGWIIFMALFYLWGYFPFVLYALPYVLRGYTLALVPGLLILLIYAIIATYSKKLDVDMQNVGQGIFRFFLGEKRFFYGLHPFRKNIFKPVFAYVFGEKRPQADERASSKNILNYLSAHQHKITSAELAALTGLSLQKAENEAAKLLAQYHGDISVTDKGVIVYEFPELKNQLHQSEKLDSKFIWDNPKETSAWNENFVFENGFITFIGVFIFIASGALLFSGGHMAFDLIPDFFLAHWLPFSFTSIYFLVGLSGKFRHLAHNKKVQQKNQQYDIWKILFQQPAVLDDKSTTLGKAIYSLEGTYDVDNNGDTIAVFPRIAEELEEITRIREESISFENPTKKQEKEGFEETILNTHIRYYQNEKELILNIKKRGKSTAGLNLALFIMLEFLLTLFMIPSILFTIEHGGITYVGSFFLILIFLGLTYKTMAELSFLINGYQFHFKPEKCKLTSGPIPFVGINTEFVYDNFAGLRSKRHIGNLHKLMFSLKNQRFAHLISGYEPDRESFIAIEDVISDYLVKHWLKE